MERRPDRFPVILDANVLVGALARNILLSLAEDGTFRPRWSAKILEEMDRALERRGKQRPYLDKLKSQMERAFPEAFVEEWEVYEAACAEMPDPDDRHVLAAVIKCDAAVIVTENLKHFPQKLLARFAIEPIATDEFIADLIDLNQADAVLSIRRMLHGFNSPTMTPEALVERMNHVGLTASASLLAASPGFMR